MALLFRRDEGRWFLRCLPTHPTEAAARAAAKARWREGDAVRVWPGRRGWLPGWDQRLSKSRRRHRLHHRCRPVQAKPGATGRRNL